MNNLSRSAFAAVVFASHTLALPASAAALLEQNQPNLSIRLDAVPKPVKGAPYRFSLCTGALLDSKVESTQCMPQDAVSVVGATPNVGIVFQLASGTFLPPGFTLDGNGVINGTADADPSKLKDIKVCAIQVGGFGTNYNCKGKTIRFKNKVAFTPSNAAKVTRLALAGAVGVGTFVGLQAVGGSIDDLGGFTTGGTTTTPTTGGGISATETYSASVQRSCQTGAVNSNPLSPGFIEPCNSAVAQGACSATNFTISVSNGVVRDCGGWLANGTLTSSGAYSGLYVGVCGSGGITVSGNLSSRLLQGTGVCRGNTYTVAITLTRQ